MMKPLIFFEKWNRINLLFKRIKDKICASSLVKVTPAEKTLPLKG